MTETERTQHPQDPAEGPDEERQNGERQNGERQNEERELHDGDDVAGPGGEEPPD